MSAPAGDVGAVLGQFATGRVCVADLLCDRHAAASPDRPAILYEGAGSESVQVSYGQLRDRSQEIGRVLHDAGVRKGDRVGVLLPRSPELVATLLAIWRLGAVHMPLFTAFGPDAVLHRLTHSAATALIVDADHRHALEPGSWVGRVLCFGQGSVGDIDIHRELRGSKPIDAVTLGVDDPFILLYTSGTTGHPKGVPMPVKALGSIELYMNAAVDLNDDDVFWNLSDPGWGYGLWYGIVGSLLLGQRMILRNVPFVAADIIESLIHYRVTNLLGSPTAFRALRAEGVPADFRERANLRAISSAGEPLNPELLIWSQTVLGVAIHDHYGQSEVGMIAGFPHRSDVAITPRPASMGGALPGFRVVVVDQQGAEVAPNTVGQLAVDVERSPAYWFPGYEQDPERTSERFPFGPRYYCTGDTAHVDTDGIFYFASRADDVITSSGYRIGPFEVESALICHPNVVEVAVVGTPDELRGEAVTAFVVTVGTEQSAELVNDLRESVRTRLSRHLVPRHIVFVEALPRTESGKIRRTELRDHQL